MAKYLTKHSPVDDKPYLVYTSTFNGDPDITTDVSIEATKSIAKGSNYTFPVTIEGTGNYDPTVVWSLDVESGGTIASGTELSQAGKLTVAAGQGTSKKLYVTATASGGQSSTCTVTVTSS